MGILLTGHLPGSAYQATTSLEHTVRPKLR